MKPPCPNGKLCAAVHDECENGCIEQRWLNMTDIPEVGEDWFKKARLRMPTDIRAEAREALDHREVWFIFSPRDESWANLRIATFTKAMNRPHLELVVIHNEVGGRLGVRVWDDIVESEGWFKVRQIDVPDTAEVIAASIKAKENDGSRGTA